MNPDNPYAAPQTIEPPFAADEPLPVATLIGRQRYPELDTVTLLRLVKLSKALEAATVLWMFPLLGCVGPGLMFLLFGRWGWRLGSAVLLVLSVGVLRLYVGSARKPAHRMIMRWADGLFLAVMITGMAWCVASFWEAPELVLFVLLVLGSFALLLAQSIRATFYAQALFGPTSYYVHWQLVTEAEHRRTHGIA
jgi:hypothetical protein